MTFGPGLLHRVAGEFFFISLGVLFDIFWPGPVARALRGRSFGAGELQGRSFQDLGELFFTSFQNLPRMTWGGLGEDLIQKLDTPSVEDPDHK